MEQTNQLGEKLKNALRESDWDVVEELWLESLDAHPIPTEELLEARRTLWSAGKKILAMTLLELLAENLENQNDSAGALAALREVVRLRKTNSPADVKRLHTALKAVREGCPSLKGVLEKYDLLTTRKPLEALDAIELILDHDVGTVVEVVGQGVGRVSGVNLQLENIKIDIGGHRPVSMPFGAASRYLRRLPEGDFLRLRVEQPEQLKKEVIENPGEILVSILLSLGKESDVAAIKTAMGDLLPTSKWSSWWTKARKHPRILSSGVGSRLRYSVSTSAESAAERLLDELRDADERTRITIAKQLIARGGDTVDAAAEILIESLEDLEISEPGLAWETASILSGVEIGADEAKYCRSRLIDHPAPQHILSGIRDRAGRIEALNAFKEQRSEDWISIWSTWLQHEESAATLTSIANELEKGGGAEALDSAIETIFRNHLSHPFQFVWGLENISSETPLAPLTARMTPSLLEKIPDTLSRGEFTSLRSRGKNLLDGGKVAIRVILESASPRQAERFANRIARISGVEPHRVHLIEQAAAQVQNKETEVEVVIFAASKPAIETKRLELKELIEITIPTTLKGINAAAAEGDLRENFEYHMLRGRQELMSAQAAKLQEDLGRVRVLNPGAADTSEVNIGTVIHFEPSAGDAIEPVTILGDWDANVDERIFANGTPLAIGLLGHKIGDEIDIDDRKAKITKIEAWAG